MSFLTPHTTNHSKEKEIHEMRDYKTDGLIIKFFEVSEVNLSISSKRGPSIDILELKV